MTLLLFIARVLGYFRYHQDTSLCIIITIGIELISYS